MARALAGVLHPEQLTVIVNIGDDDEMYGLHVSPDVDTVLYTLAGIEGPQGWGRRGDTFNAMAGLRDFGVDTTFQLGDRDLALCLRRTIHLSEGGSLSSFTEDAAAALGVEVRVLPVTDDRLRTKVLVRDGGWLDFQDYFVLRRHRDRVRGVRFDGAEQARPAPGVIGALAEANAVVIAPSNPILSVDPILAVPGLREIVAEKPVVAAVSPLFRGEAIKGPAASIMADLGLPPGNEGVLRAYDGLISHLVVDAGDVDDAIRLGGDAVDVLAADTRIIEPEAGVAFAERFLELIGLTPHPAAA